MTMYCNLLGSTFLSLCFCLNRSFIHSGLLSEKYPDSTTVCCSTIFYHALPEVAVGFTFVVSFLLYPVYFCIPVPAEDDERYLKKVNGVLNSKMQNRS